MISNAVTFRYLERIRNVLLARQDRGIGQHDLNQKVRVPKSQNHEGTTAADLRQILNNWHERRWVDRFEVTPYGQKPEQRWRATTLLRDEWHRFIEVHRLAIAFAAGEVSIDPSAIDASPERTAHPEQSSLEQSSDQ